MWVLEEGRAGSGGVFTVPPSIATLADLVREGNSMAFSCSHILHVIVHIVTRHSKITLNEFRSRGV